MLMKSHDRTERSRAAPMLIDPDLFEDVKPTQFQNTADEAGSAAAYGLVRGDLERGRGAWGSQLDDFCDHDAGLAHQDGYDASSREEESASQRDVGL